MKSRMLSDPAMTYEESIRYVHNNAKRFEVRGAGTEDYSVAVASDGWGHITLAIRHAFELLRKDGADVKWGTGPEQEQANHQLQTNLEAVIELLDSTEPTPANTLLAMAMLARITKALVTALAVDRRANGQRRP